MIILLYCSIIYEIFNICSQSISRKFYNLKNFIIAYYDIKVLCNIFQSLEEILELHFEFIGLFET